MREQRARELPHDANRTVLPKRCDAFLYMDETEVLHPLHIEPEEPNPPDLYPWGV